MKIRSYLALMVGAILVPVIAFSAITLNLLLNAEREAALKGVREMARISLVSIDRELTNTQSALRMLSISSHLSNGEFAQFYDKAKYADQFGDTFTALLDEQGALVLTTSVPYGAPLPPTTALERVTRVLDSGQWQVSNLVRAAVTRQNMVLVDVPVTTASGRRYVLSQGYNIEHFKHVLRDAILNKTVGVIRNASDQDVRLYTVLERSSLSGWTVAVGVPEAEIEAVARRALTLSLLGLVAALVCAGATAWLFARRISMSIRAAARSAKALEQGDEPGPAGQSGVVEVDALQGAIVAAGAVINREKAQRQAAEDERARLFASEHEARTMAERQNRAKDEFLAMLGHELRNPLAAIVNATQVLKIGGAGASAGGGAAAKASTIIARQSGHLTRIVDDLLDVGRVHSGKILLARRPLRLDLLVAVHADTVSAGRGAGHRFEVQLAPAWVDADPTRIEQVVANLVDNAIKYTPAGGRIALSVALSADGQEAVLAVADSGMGITPELMPNVFELFVQGERALDRAQGGMGVGLALVRQLAVMHGGRVAVQSGGAGQGSRFELRLPAIAAPQEAPAAAAGPSSTGEGDKPRILLIEDNDDGREMMAMMLEAQGYTVLPAADGPQGLAVAAAQPAAIALIDIGLPGIDGYEVARRLRADPATCAIRLVALTGYGLETDRQHALAAGFDSHLVKPVDLHRLLEVLEQAGSVLAL